MRRQRRHSRAERRGTRAAKQSRRDRRVPLRGGKHRRHLRRHRRQSRPGARGVAARPARHAARPHDLRRAVPCRRQDDRYRARRGRGDDQRGPDVALHRGREELGADLAGARHPHPARPVLDVVRRGRQPPARTLPAGFRHAVDAETSAHNRPRPFLVHPDAEGDREGIRAFRIGAESRFHLREMARGAETAPRQRGNRGPSRPSSGTARISSSATRWRNLSPA